MTPVKLPKKFDITLPQERWDLFSLEDVYDFLTDRLRDNIILKVQYGPLDVLSITTIKRPKKQGNAKVKIVPVPTQDTIVLKPDSDLFAEEDSP